VPRAGSVAVLAFRAPLKRNEAPRPTWPLSVIVIDRTPHFDRQPRKSDVAARVRLSFNVKTLRRAPITMCVDDV
jgi:hypothetical protein